MLEVLMEMSRHREVVDEEMGVGGTRVRVEGEGLVGALVASGVGLEEFKRMTVEERARVVLEVGREGGTRHLEGAVVVPGAAGGAEEKPACGVVEGAVGVPAEVGERMAVERQVGILAVPPGGAAGE